MLLGLHGCILILYHDIISRIFYAFSLLYTTYIHIGSEEDIPVEYVIVEEESPQELPPEGEGHTSELLLECPNHGPSTFHRGKPQTFHILLISILILTWVMLNFSYA
jgi:hypothetical protein